MASVFPAIMILMFSTHQVLTQNCRIKYFLTWVVLKGTTRDRTPKQAQNSEERTF